MWDYRIMKRKINNEICYDIYEVYYDKGKITGFTKDAIAPRGTSLKDLKADLLYMIQALSKPVLDYDKRCKDEDKVV